MLRLKRLRRPLIAFVRHQPAEVPPRSTIYARVEPYVRVAGYSKLVCHLLPSVRHGNRCCEFMQRRRFAGILAVGRDRPGDGGGGTVTECPRTGAPDDF